MGGGKFRARFTNFQISSRWKKKAVKVAVDLPDSPTTNLVVSSFVFTFESPSS